MSMKKPDDVKVLPNSEPHKTKVLAFHLYLKHYTQFLQICERIEKFHSEVLRALVMDFIKNNKDQPLGDESKGSQAPFTINY